MAERSRNDAREGRGAPAELLPTPGGTAVTSDDAAGDSLSTASGESLVGGAVSPGLGQRPLRPGARLGRYMILAELGTGGMGAVYKAWDPALERVVALKVLLAGRFAMQRQVDRFLDEAKAIARLDHGALVEVYDIGLVDGCPYFTMAFVDGPPLTGLLEDGPLDPERACRLLAQVARGLHEAHRHGIIHRDVKPANILVEADDAARLIDFGIARFLESTDERTRTGQVIGTPAYMAPEQARGELDAIGPATDVFGLGACLLRAVSGQLPRTIRADAMGAMDAMDAMGVPRGVAAICHKAMQSVPSMRYGTIAALADDMDRFARGEPVDAALPGPWTRLAWRLRQARPVLAGAGIAAALAVLAWLALGAWQDHQALEAATAREVAADARLTEALLDARRLRSIDAAAAADVERAATLRTDVQQTRALARFHLRRAEDALARQDRPGALAAAASAYATAIDDAESFDAMLALGEMFVELRRGSALGALVGTLERRFPARRKALAALAIDAAVFEGRLADAARLSSAVGSPRAPVLEALGRVEPTPWTDADLDGAQALLSTDPVDVDGDGHLDLAFGRRVLSARSPTLPEAELPVVPDGQYPAVIAPGLVAGRTGSTATRLMTLEGDRWREVAPLDRSVHLAWSDLDGDGHPTLYGARSWGVSAFAVQPDGTWKKAVPHPPSNAASIEPRGLFAADFGPRGRALVMGTSGWKSYDLRVYTPGADGGLVLAARRKVGAITALARVDRPDRTPLIALALRPFEGDDRLFPPEAPIGIAPGVHLFDWTDAGLVSVAHMPIVADHHGLGRMVTGDLDGDGRDDLIVAATIGGRRDVVIYRALADGWSAPIALPGLSTPTAVDIDGDGDDELIVRTRDEGRLVVLGLADGTPGDVPVERPAAVDVAPSSIGDVPRAEAIGDLVRLGLVDEAIDAWQHRLQVEPSAAAALSAAHLTESLTRFDASAAFYREAVELAADDAGATVALQGAARTLRSARRWDAERRVLDRLLERPLTSEARAAAVARRDALVARLDQRVVVDPGGDLDPRWQIRVPDRLWVDRTGALEIDSDHVGPILRVPLERTGGPIALDLAMETPRLEYGGSIEARLVAVGPGGERRNLAEFFNLAWGGGSIVFHRAHAIHPNGAHILFFNERIEQPVGHRVHVRLELDPEAGRAYAVERTRAYYDDYAIPALADDARLYLQIGAGTRDLRRGWRARVRIDRLVLDGVHVVDAGDDPAWRDLWADLEGPEHGYDAVGGPDRAALQAGIRALAEGAPADALRAVDGVAGTIADVVRAAGSYDLGRWAEADRITEGLLTDAQPGAPGERFARGRLIRDPLHFGPLIRRAMGLAADELIGLTFGAAFDKHRADPEVGVAGRAALLGADGDSVEDLARSAHAGHRIDLLLARAEMHRATGRVGAARADLESCAALLSALPPPDDERAARRRQDQWARVHRVRAEVHAEAGRVDLAADAMKAALAAAPAPELVADRIIASPAMKVMRRQPIWSTIERAANWGAPDPAP